MSLAKSNDGINIRQPLKGGVKEAAVTARRTFEGSAGRKVMATVERNSWQRILPNDAKQLRLIEVSVFGTNAKLLFDSETVPNVMSAIICSQTFPTSWKKQEDENGGWIGGTSLEK